MNNDQQFVTGQPAMIYPPQVPIYPTVNQQQPDYNQQQYGQQAYYNNMQQDQSYGNNPNRKSYIRGINVFLIPVFTHFNPQNAIFILNVNGKTGDLIIEMAPAIPNNAAIGLRGPVPVNTKVYDYDKKTVSSMQLHEIASVVTFLRNKFSPDMRGYFRLCEDNKNKIDNLMNIFKTYFSTNNEVFKQSPDYQSIYAVCNEIMTQLSNLNQYNQQLISDVKNQQKSNSENQVGLYRKGSDFEDKAWNFNYDEKNDMLYISLMLAKDKNRRYSLGFSKAAALNLLTVMESYYNNYVTNSMVAALTSQLSMTLAKNGMMAPTKKELEMTNYQ